MAAIYKNFQTNSNSELDRIFSLGFKDCAEYISKMDTMKKASVAAEVQHVLDSLYAQTDRYGNPDYCRDDQIDTNAFIFIMGKIKRYETILYWLYEIDIMMAETELDRLILEAERKLEANGGEDYAKAKTIEAPRKKQDPTKSPTVKKTTYVSAKEDLATLHMERMARGNHTEEIMDLAATLTAKYYKAM